MKACDLASASNIGHVGPVRLTGGKEVFRFVRWTRGKVKAGEREQPRMVTLGRINGSVGNCTVTHRYVSPETELEHVAPPISLDEYQEKALCTAIYPKEKGIEYTFLGLPGEVGELQEKLAVISNRVLRKASVRKALLDELGDVCWYVATAAHELGYKLSQLPNLGGKAKAIRRCFRNPIEAALRLSNALGGATGKLPNKFKKTIRDECPIEDYVSIIVEALGETLGVIQELTELLGSTIEEVMQANLAKLSDRARREVLSGSGDNR